jgi:hypothetical protein
MQLKNKKEVSEEETENPEEIKRVKEDKERKKKPYGIQSPSSADLLKLEKLTTLLISSDSLSQSKNQKLLTNSSVNNLKNKSWKLNPSKNKPKPVKEPDSKLSPLLVMDLIILVSDGNAIRKFKVPSRVLSSWPNLTFLQLEKVIGVTKSVLLTPSHAKLLEKVVQLKLEWSQPQEVLV